MHLYCRHLEVREANPAAKQQGTDSEGASKAHHEDNEWNICVLESNSLVKASSESAMCDQQYVDIPNSTVTELMAGLQETQQS